MAWGPILPARLAFDAADGTPLAPDFGDLYHARGGALAQARQVFLAGNGLPGRWQGRERFVVLETGFGLGQNFLATWAAWRADPQRPRRLWFVSVEKHPPGRDELARALAPHRGDAAIAPLAQALIDAWPPATPDIHLRDFDGGALRLLLALGDVAAVLPELVAPVDAFFLDGFAPDRNPAMWAEPVFKALPRLAAPGATAATWSAAAAVRQGLQAGGFQVERVPGFDGKRHRTQAVHAPRHVASPPPGRQPAAGLACAASPLVHPPGRPRRVVVVGAGLAGAAAAAALAARGVAVTVLDRQPGPAMETSGNAGGMFHGVLHAEDGVHARWFRAAALHAQRGIGSLILEGKVSGQARGLVRGEHRLDEAGMAAALRRSGLPDEWVQCLAAADGAPATGPLSRAAWLFAGGGWASPADLVRAWLDAPGITLHTGAEVARLAPAAARPQVDARGDGAGAPGDPGGSAEPGTPGAKGAKGATGATGATRGSVDPADSAHGGNSGPHEGWQLLAADGRLLAQADAVVLANAADARRLLGDAGLAVAGWPLGRRRGQTTVLPAGALPAAAEALLARPLADGGYALRLADGCVLCGATNEPVPDHDHDAALRPADQRHNLAVLSRLTGTALDPAFQTAALDGRAGWRLGTDDRLPLVGPVPSAQALAQAQAQTVTQALALASPQRAAPSPIPGRWTQPRQVPRTPGLWLLTALGSRGITQAGLAGELLAAWMLGDPWPVPAALADAVDPARFVSRAARHRGG